MGSDWKDFGPDVPWPDYGWDDEVINDEGSVERLFSPVLGDTGASIAGIALKAAAVAALTYGTCKLVEGLLEGIKPQTEIEALFDPSPRFADWWDKPQNNQLEPAEDIVESTTEELEAADAECQF